MNKHPLSKRIGLFLGPLLFIILQVLPLEFINGETRHTHNIDGTETFDVEGTPAPGATLTLVINRANGEQVKVPMTCRLDTAEEVSVYEAGGVLQRFAQDFLEASEA